MRIPPIEVLVSWPKPNYINPESRAPAGKVIGSILVVLVTIILAIRVYSRKKLTKGFGLDDTIICLAYVPAAAFAIIGIITQELFQLGRHTWDVEPKFFSPGVFVTLIMLFLFDLSTSLTKLSMLAMVRRLTAASNNKVENAAVLILAALITVNCFIFITVETFQCWPVSEGWTVVESSSSNHCINEKAHLMTANVINTITDFVVVLLPIRTVASLQLSSRQRVVVISLFGIGLIASSVGIARTYFTWLLFTAADYDTIWNAWYLWLSSLIELHLGIICASIPATKPFFASYMHSMIGSTQGQHNSLMISGTQAIRGDQHKRHASDASVSPLSPAMSRTERQIDLYKLLPRILELDTSSRGSVVSFAVSNRTDTPPQKESFTPQRHGMRSSNLSLDHTNRSRTLGNQIAVFILNDGNNRVALHSGRRKTL
ncbi:hypothetical protein HD806DRAFT_12214 [Xylariaceae sp. AK1471]|nr:hypothetical protein HD806DRAFT_12214 [Xylariaceae sp. AK1471]